MFGSTIDLWENGTNCTWILSTGSLFLSSVETAAKISVVAKVGYSSLTSIISILNYAYKINLNCFGQNDLIWGLILLCKNDVLMFFVFEDGKFVLIWLITMLWKYYTNGPDYKLLAPFKKQSISSVVPSPNTLTNLISFVWKGQKSQPQRLETHLAVFPHLNTITHGPWAYQPTDFTMPKTQNS